jgi:hypothetical protein
VQDADTVVGNDIAGLDTARWQLRSPFERDIVTKFDCQVILFMKKTCYVWRRIALTLILLIPMRLN